MLINKNNIIQIIFLASCLILCFGVNISAAVQYDPNTMNYPVSPQEAENNIHSWMNDSSLSLVLMSVSILTPISNDIYNYRTTDKSKYFKVNTSNGRIDTYINKELKDLSNTHYQLNSNQNGTIVSNKLPISELQARMVFFLQSHYSEFVQMNMQQSDNDNFLNGYSQYLANNIQYPYNVISCKIDEWTGDIYSSSSSFIQTTVNIPLTYTIDSASAETIALNAVNNRDAFELYEEEGHTPKTALIYANRGLYFQKRPEDNGQQRITWNIVVIASVFENYTLDAFKLAWLTMGDSNGPLGSTAYCVEIDANTGQVIHIFEIFDLEVYGQSTIPPVMTPASGTYNTTQNVVLSSSVPQAVIRYTINGTTPTINSPVYSQPIVVDHNLTIKARAYKTGLRASSAVTADYVITE